MRVRSALLFFFLHLITWQKVSDIKVVGVTQQGVNMNLGRGLGGHGNPSPAPCVSMGNCLRTVVNYEGPSGIVMKKVPCPVEGNIRLGVRGFGTSPLAGNNTELIPLHFRVVSHLFASCLFFLIGCLGYRLYVGARSRCGRGSDKLEMGPPDLDEQVHLFPLCFALRLYF